MFRSQRSTRLGQAAVCAAAVLAVHASAFADLTIDLRATTVNGAPLSGGQTQHAIPNALVGDVIAFDIFAVVTGTDANFTNDRITAAVGSFKSTTVAGTFRGNLQADVVRTTFDSNGDPVTAGFDRIGYSIGTQQDLDADGDIDVGSNFDSSAQHFWIANYAIFGGSLSAGLPNGRKIGFGTFTVTNSTGAALVNFFGRSAQTGAIWTQDGVQMFDESNDSPPQSGILVSGIPEPSTSCIAAGAATALTCFRRRRQRPSLQSSAV